MKRGRKSSVPRCLHSQENNKSAKRPRKSKELTTDLLPDQDTSEIRRELCMKWMLEQNQIENDGEHNSDPDFTYNSEEIATTSNNSLKQLRRVGKSYREVFHFECEWRQCNARFDNDMQMYQHSDMHIKNPTFDKGIYYCEWDLCNFETGCLDEMTRHIHYHAYHTVLKTFGASIIRIMDVPPCTRDSRERNVVPVLSTNFVCRWAGCEMSIHSIDCFHKHVREHTNDIFNEFEARSNKTFDCRWDNCQLKFPNKYRLTEHVRKHTNEKLVGCYHCGELFWSNTTFFDHCKRQITNNTQEYQCAQCDKYFASERLLRVHAFVHINCFKCTLCDMTCSSHNKLVKHIRYRHIQERPVECVHCNYKSVNKSDMEKHMLLVHVKKEFECVELGCDFTCKSLYLLRKHDTTVHGTPPSIYACHCCEDVFKTGQELSKHLIKIHGFQLPPGHRRFAYRLDEAGVYRLQTMRIESLEVTKQILSPNIFQPEVSEDICYEVSELENNKSNTGGLSYKVIAAAENSTDLYECRSNSDTNISASNMRTCTDIVKKEEKFLVTISDGDMDGNVIQIQSTNATELKIANV